MSAVEILQNDFPISAPVQFGLERLHDAAEGLTLRLMRETALPPRACRLTRTGDVLTVSASDEAGMMDGLIEAADRLALADADELWSGEALYPAIRHRGVKLNVPLDARTPSYTDCGDSAQANIAAMWDMDFWRGFLDRMASQHYNALTLWNLCPFPSMVAVPEYPKAALEDVMISTGMAGGTSRALGFCTEETERKLICLKRMTMAEKIAHWRQVFDYAAARCIDVYLFTWNLYLYGVADSGYGLTEAADDEGTKEYLRCSVAALLRTYPQIRGIGVTAGENLTHAWTEQQDMGWVRETYGQGIERVLAETPDRPVTLILRAHMTTLAQMQQAFADYPGQVEVSAKYAMAHMTATPRPRFTEDFLNAIPAGMKTWLTLRNDDFYLFPWADAPFLTALVAHMPTDIMDGFYVGSDGVIWGMDQTSRDGALRGRYFIDKHFMSFVLLGRLGWRGRLLPGEEALLVHRIAPSLPADKLIKAWQAASRAVSRVSLCHWRPYDLQWYPEACCSLREEEKLTVFHDLLDFMEGESCPGTGVLSVKDTAVRLLAGEAAIATDALGVAGEIMALAGEAEGCMPSEAGNPAERQLVRDIRRGTLLARYYGRKLQAAVYLSCYQVSGDLRQRELAHRLMSEGAAAYEQYAEATAADYRSQRLSRLRGVVSPDMFIQRSWLDVKRCEEGKHEDL